MADSISAIAAHVEHDAKAAMLGDSNALERLRDELHSLHSDQLKALAPMLENSFGKSSNRLFGGVEVNRDARGAVDSITFVPPVKEREAGGHSVQTSVAINNFVDDAERLVDKLNTHKGTLTTDDVVAAASKLPAGSPDALTLAALGHYMFHDPDGPFEFGIKRSDLENLRTNWKKFPDLKEVEDEARKAPTSDSRLYGSKGISPNAVHEGPGSDSMFETTLADLAKKDPARIRRMIKDNNNGTYTVTIAPGHAFTVAAPTESERVVGNRGGDYGIWPEVVEKAYDAFQKTVNFSPDALGFLTNKKAEQIEPRNYSNEQFSTLLQKYMESTGAVIAITTPFMENKTVDGFAALQAYSVLAFDPKGPDGGTVTVRNPTGGRDNTSEGQWKLSLRAFRANFALIDASSAQSSPFYWGAK